MRGFLGQQRKSVREDIVDGLEALGCTFGRPRSVDDYAATKGAGEAPGEPAQAADQAHGFGQTGRLAVEDGNRALRRQIAGGETGAAGGDDEAAESAGHLLEGGRDSLN